MKRPDVTVEDEKRMNHESEVSSDQKEKKTTISCDTNQEPPIFHRPFSKKGRPAIVTFGNRNYGVSNQSHAEQAACTVRLNFLFARVS